MRHSFTSTFLAAIALLVLSSARHAGERRLSGEWWLDVRGDSAAFFSADTLRFTNVYALNLPGGSGEYASHRPCLLVGSNGDLRENECCVSVERDTVREDRLLFFGTFQARGGEIIFMFRKPAKNKEPVSERERWFSRKYLAIEFEKDKKLVLKKLGR